MNPFEEELEKFLKVFEKYSKDFFGKKSRSVVFYPPIIKQHYINLADFSSGGKRMRAFLVWLGYQVAQSSITGAELLLKKILPISLAIEIIHSFLLIHDDIIDKSETRHGGPTIHKRYEKLVDSHYGLSQAILVGDIACFEAFDLVNSSSFSDSLKVICQGQLIKILIATGYGEVLDVESTYRGGSLALIRQVMDLKTARYSFVGPLTIGATLGSARGGQIEGLSRFGLSAGMAFQLRDDILGVFGDEKIVGKPMDFSEGKNTILMYKTNELANAKEKAILARTWGRRKANLRDLRRVREIVKECGALEWCEKEQLRLARVAKSVIGEVTSDKRLQIILGQIVDFVVNREK